MQNNSPHFCCWKSKELLVLVTFSLWKKIPKQKVPSDSITKTLTRILGYGIYTFYIMIELMSSIYSPKCKTILKQKYRFYHNIDNTNALIEAKHIICLKRTRTNAKQTNTIEVVKHIVTHKMLMNKFKNYLKQKKKKKKSKL